MILYSFQGLKICRFHKFLIKEYLCAKIGFASYNFIKYYNLIIEYTALNNIEVWLKMCIICLVFIDYYCFRNSIFKFKFGKVYNRCRNGVRHLFGLFVKTLKINYTKQKNFALWTWSVFGTNFRSSCLLSTLLDILFCNCVEWPLTKQHSFCWVNIFKSSCLQNHLSIIGWQKLIWKSFQTLGCSETVISHLPIYSIISILGK